LLSFNFSFHHLTAEPQRLPIFNYFLLRITITITSCNSSTSDVGGSLLPRLILCRYFPFYIQYQ
jgi:hypothetical protein